MYCIGQQKQTWRARIVVRKTIGERMAKLQHTKLVTIDAAIKEHNLSKIALTPEEIAGLLGRVVLDEHGKIQNIVPDYDEEDSDEQGNRDVACQAHR